MTPLDTVLVPARAAHSATIVWLHGLGASGHDFEPVVPMMNRPDVRWVFPHAPQRPVTINGGFVMPAWYDIKTLERGPGREDADDIVAASKQISALLDSEVERLGGRSQRLLLLGFSQGAAMSLHVGLRYPKTLAGVGCLSGYLVLEGRLEGERSAKNQATPVWFGHGTRDDVVPAAGGRHANERLQKLGYTTSWQDWPMGHEVCLDELEALRDWFGAVLPVSAKPAP